MFQLDQKTLIVAGAALAGLIVIGFLVFLLLRRSTKSKTAELTGPAELAAPAGADLEQQIESRLAQADAMKQQAEAKALSSLKLAPVITKTAEVMAKHLREKIAQESEVSAQVLRTWIREEEI